MSILFKKIRWKNFLSTGNIFTEVFLNKSKSTLIVGNNGAGKSTMLDALSFVLYGKPFRKINKPQLMNSINGKNLVVEVEFAIGKHEYKIVRGIKPSVFEVYQNNSLINQNADSKEYQELLEKQILKMTHKSFSQIVILGSASFTPFMQLSSAHRREVIEDLLDIQVFSTMNTLLKSKMQQIKEDIIRNDMSINSLEQQIDLQLQNIEKLRANNQEIIEQHRQNISKYQQELIIHNNEKAKLDDEVKVCLGLISDQDKVTGKLRSLNNVEVRLIEKKNSVEKDIMFYETHESCPTCKQGLDDSFKDTKIGNHHYKLREIEDALVKLKDEKQACESRMNEISTHMVKFNELQMQQFNNTQQIKTCHSFIDSHNASIKQIEQHITKQQEDTTQIDDLKQQLEHSINEKTELSKRKGIYDQAALILKDTGIKTKIIKQYVPVMNKLINKYLASMDFFVNFELNENFEEKIKSRYRDEFSYASFSEGEKLRIDLALLFTWRAISKLRSSASTNLLIMDEIFDSSLDTSGTEEFLKIIETLASDTNIFVISHKSDSLYDKFHSVIKFEKHKNFSRIAS